MRIAVLGTGRVGRALASALADLGHTVRVGTRDPATTRARADAVDGEPMSEWLVAHPQITLGTWAQATDRVDLVVNATAGRASITALVGAGAGHLDGVVLLDVANPVADETAGATTLYVTASDCLAEQIQATFPAARVVKALNTVDALLMARPDLLGDGDHTTFVSGNDNAAKAVVVGLLERLGHTDVIDLGDLSTARCTEAAVPLWRLLCTVLDTRLLALKVVR